MTKLDEFLATHNFPGRIITAKVWGSRSHNTELPTSDWDFSGIFAAPVRDFLGMKLPPDTLDGKNPDYSFHEVGKFCNLLIKGNPGIIEMLWTEKMCIETPEWLQLKSMRKQFLSCEVVTQYLGYSQGQLQRLVHGDGKSGLHCTGGAYTEKWAYHIVRLLGDALRIAQGGEPRVWKDGQEQEFLMKIRHHDYNWEYIAGYISEQLAIIEGLKPWSLPEKGDRKSLEDWLIRLRLSEI